MNLLKKYLTRELKNNNLYIIFHTILYNDNELQILYRNLYTESFFRRFKNEYKREKLLKISGNNSSIIDKLIDVIDNVYNKFFNLGVFAHREKIIHNINYDTLSKYLDDNGLVWATHQKFSSVKPFTLLNDKFYLRVNSRGTITYGYCEDDKMFYFEKALSEKEFYEYWENYKKEFNNKIKKCYE